MKLFICAQVFVYYLLWTMAIHIPFSISFIANCYHVVVNFDLSQEYVHKFSIDIFGVAPSLSVSPDKLVFTKYNTHTYSERYMNVARVFCIYTFRLPFTTRSMLRSHSNDLFDFDGATWLWATFQFRAFT